MTVITAVKNGAAALEQTIQSVISQSQEHIEYIIVDGGSTDGTLDIIRKYDNVLSYWVSEPDRGIYDAMNKGWSIAGDSSFVLFLGAGDRIISLPQHLEKFTTHDVIFGRVDLGEGRLFNSRVGMRLRLGNTLHHQALLVNKMLSPEPPFDTRYRVYGDFDFNQRLLKRGVRFVYADDFLSYAMPGGISKDLHIRENAAIVRKNYGIFWASLALLYLSVGLLKRACGLSKQEPKQC